MRSLAGGGRGRADMGYLVSEVIQARFKFMLDPVLPSFVTVSYNNASQSWLRYAQPSFFLIPPPIVTQFANISRPRSCSMLPTIKTRLSHWWSALARIIPI